MEFLGAVESVDSAKTEDWTKIEVTLEMVKHLDKKTGESVTVRKQYS